MKKVLIASCYFKNNYGSQLQAYATQKVLEDMNINCENIDISKNQDFKKGKRKYYISQILNFNFISTKFGMIKFKVQKILFKNLKNNIGIRNKKMEEFKKVYKLTKPYKTYRELNEACKEYDAVIVGSDQLWLPVNAVADYYTLNFVPKEIKKISYATSFGVSEIPKKYDKIYSNFLNKIDNISVREKSGQKIIKKLINKDVEVVCDPTILLNKEEWMQIQDENRIVKDKYILCYFLGSNIMHRKFAERLKAETGYKIVSLNHSDEYVSYSEKFADEAPYDVGPIEFLNLIRNAEYVCTDSFHGTVFSLINNKRFFSFRRHNGKSKSSTNSRIDTLLEKVDLSDRILLGSEDVKDEIKKEIDYNKVNNILESFRKESRGFLERALN